MTRVELVIDVVEDGAPRRRICAFGETLRSALMEAANVAASTGYGVPGLALVLARLSDTPYQQ